MGWEAKLDIKEALQIGNHTTKEKYKHNLQKQEHIHCIEITVNMQTKPEMTTYYEIINVFIVIFTTLECSQ